MSCNSLLKFAIIIPLLILLAGLDTLPSLQGLPGLLLALGLALLVTGRLRTWLRTSGRAGLGALPFMAAALVLLFAFCRGRDLPQIVLFSITVAVVFDVLLVALAAIGEATKRGAKGLLEFLAVASLGLALGFVVSLAFLVEISRLGGASLAQP
jgi:hypothetical protein